VKLRCSENAVFYSYVMGLNCGMIWAELVPCCQTTSSIRYQMRYCRPYLWFKIHHFISFST